MKRYLKSIPLILFALMTGCGGSSQYMVKATPTAAPHLRKPWFISCGRQVWLLPLISKYGTAVILSV